MRSRYSDVSWFLRAARVVPVIAGAALLGGMIGGFAMFAVDSALTWDSAPPRPDARAENAASAVNSQPSKPVRIVGGAIPDPSAGMSAPPPVQQPEPQRNSASAQPQTQVSPQLLTAKPMGPLGPASHLQSQTATAAPASTSAPPQNQIANQPQSQTSVQKPVQTQNAPAAQQQTRWPDALSRARQNAANGGTPSAQQPTATAPAAQGSEDAANKNKEADSKDTNTERAANADDQDRAKASRHDRHSRRWHDARSYDRLYDSYGNARRQSYRGYRDDQDDAAARSDQSRSDQRQYGRDTRSRGRSRDIVRDQPDESDRGQSFETSRRRPEPFWGGGFFRRGYQDDD